MVLETCVQDFPATAAGGSPDRAQELAEARAELWALLLGLPPAAREFVLADQAARSRRRRFWQHERIAAAFDRLVLFEATYRDAHVSEQLARARETRARIDRARELLVLDNLHLVPHAIRRFHRSTIPFKDLIQDGHVGLLHAVDRFDPSRGHRFSTYAVWWIRRAVLEAFSHRSRLIRLPESLRGDLRHMRHTTEELEERLGRRPASSEIAAGMGVPLKKVRSLAGLAPEPTSIEDLPGQHDQRLGAQGPDPLESTLARELETQTREALSALEPRERTIIRLRFGFDGGEERTLAAVGALIGVSRERVRQLERVALKKIQAWAARRGLRHERVG